MLVGKPRHPLLVQELVRCAVDQDGLKRLMEEVVAAVNEVQREARESTESAGREKQVLGDLRREVTRLAAAQEAKIDSWSDRFTSLEAKFFSLADELYRRVDDVKKDLDVKFISAEADIEKTGKEVRREVRGHVEALEEAVVQIRVDVGRWERMRKEKEVQVRVSPTIDPAAPSPSPTFISSTSQKPTDESEPLIDPQPCNPSTGDSLLDQLDSRVTVLERRIESQKIRAQTIKSKATSAADDAESKVKTDALAAIDQKLAQTNADIQSVREEITHRLTLLETPTDPVDLSPIIARLNALEAPKPRPEPLNHSVKHVSRPLPPPLPVTPVFSPIPSSLQDSISDLQVQMGNLRTSVERLPPVFDPSDLEHEVAQVKAANAQLNSDIQTVTRAVSDLKAICKDFSSDPALASRPGNQGIPSKQLLADIGVVLATDKAAQMRHQSFMVVPQQSSEQVTALETRINGLYREQERLKAEMAANGREMSEVNQHFDRQERMLLGIIQRTHSEMTQRMAEIETLLDKPTDNPDAAKNLAALRSIIVKLQKEQKSLAEAVKSLQAGPEARQPQTVEVVEVVREEESGEKAKTMAGYLQKHDAQLKTVDKSIKQLTHELESVRIHLRRSQEGTSTASRLTEMEKFRGEVEGVLGKVMEGIKLSKRDYEMLNELYDQMETKGDKTDLAQKVDKGELKKAYHVLMKKIENCREDLRKTNESPVPAMVKEEIAAGTVHKLEFGCLSCGHEVASPDTDRDLRHSTPGTMRGLQRYGHGFSKLLPMLNDMLTPNHRRNNSEVQPGTTSTERMKRLRVRIPESLPTSVSTRIHTNSSTPLH